MKECAKMQFKGKNAQKCIVTGNKEMIHKMDFFHTKMHIFKKKCTKMH